jgi:DNA-binding CsgD family transcriptional regulator
VKTHVQRALRKLHAESRAHAVAIAFRNRLIV